MSYRASLFADVELTAQRQRGTPPTGAANASAADKAYLQRKYQEESEHRLMMENTQLLDEMESKVSSLKHLTNEIGRESKEQNRLLDDMEDDFTTAGGMLNATMKRLTNMMNTGSSNHMCYLVVFIFGLFMFMYLVLKTR